jgi:hypothetical protein
VFAFQQPVIDANGPALDFLGGVSCGEYRGFVGLNALKSNRDDGQKNKWESETF